MAENDIIFDPQLQIPEGLVGAKHGTVDDERNTSSLDVLPEDEDFFPLTDDDDSNEDLEGEDFLEVPNELVILSQTVRTAPDGTQIVDVVIDVEETSGAADYQVRVTKA